MKKRKIVKAEVAGNCIRCGGRILVGDRIHVEKRYNGGPPPIPVVTTVVAYHEECLSGSLAAGEGA